MGSHICCIHTCAKHTQTGIHSACTVHRCAQKYMLLGLQTHRPIESVWVQKLGFRCPLWGTCWLTVLTPGSMHCTTKSRTFIAPSLGNLTCLLTCFSPVRFFPSRLSCHILVAVCLTHPVHSRKNVLQEFFLDTFRWLIFKILSAF